MPYMYVNTVLKVSLPYRFFSFHILSVFSTDRKINTFKTAKQRVTNETTGVYEIPCANCNRTYAGQPNRRIQEHAKEHIRSVKNGNNKSALSQHYNQTGYNTTKLDTIL